jgi:predicted acyltransferase
MLSIGAGVVLSTFIPINKPLWTPSYVLYAGGWSVTMLALFIYFIDVKGKEKVFLPFRAMGLNPLFAFVMAGVFAKTLGRIIKWKEIMVTDDWQIKEVTVSASTWIYRNVCVNLLGHNEWGSLMYALMYVTVFLLMAMWLYKKNIIIKL